MSQALEPGAKPGCFPPAWEKGILSRGDCPKPTVGTQWVQQPLRMIQPTAAARSSMSMLPGLPGASPDGCTF